MVDGTDKFGIMEVSLKEFKRLQENGKCPSRWIARRRQRKIARHMYRFGPSQSLSDVAFGEWESICSKQEARFSAMNPLTSQKGPLH